MAGGWLAFRMSGFCGLVVPEKIDHFAHGLAWVAGNDMLHLRHMPNDGLPHDTLLECVEACDALNAGNPFWEGGWWNGREVWRRRAEGERP